MEISNPKVLTAKPTWAKFPGFSLLFDNPGESLLATRDGLRLHCKLDSDESLDLYQQLSSCLQEVLPDNSNHSCICPLPPQSYHVTYFDCGNCANAAGANEEVQEPLFELLDGLPHSLRADHPLVNPAVRHAESLGSCLDLGFSFSHIKHFGNEVLVAVLAPNDEESGAMLEELIARRAGLSSAYRAGYGFGASQKFTPHVSLAYFANHAVGEGSSALTLELDSALRTRLAGMEIRFNSVGVYAFTDMASFFRITGSA